MTFIALATDYDGTIAHHGKVDEETISTLRWVKDRGKFLILVTGRVLPELQALFPELSLFDAVVAENGGVLYLPDKGRTERLAPAPPAALVNALRAKHVEPLSVGECIVATWQPHETAVLETVRNLGLEWQIIFNKGAVMCLPPGINKASGLAAALSRLKLSPLNVIGIGDAENDHAFLSYCGMSAAVANAVPAVSKAAQIALKHDHGAGVRELVGQWLDKDSAGLPVNTTRGSISVAAGDGADGLLSPGSGAVLVAGGSGAGKSRLSSALIERALTAQAQLIVLDPEGDYDTVADLAHLGGPDRAPTATEVVDIIENDPDASMVVNLLAVPLSDRPAFAADLLARVGGVRARLARPHWVLMDEAHHFFPAEADTSAHALPQNGNGLIFVTVIPDTVRKEALAAVKTVIAVGLQAHETLANFCSCRAVDPPAEQDFKDVDQSPGDGQLLFWRIGEGPARLLHSATSQREHSRHKRKYAEGSLSPDKSFYFRGPAAKLNLRARNLHAFLDIADGVDDDTWTHHLTARHYSQWIREAIGDDEVADVVEEIETGKTDGSRNAIRAAIERKYTAPSRL